VLSARCSASDALLVVYAAGNELAWTRLGVSVGRRIGQAVRRNYIRRRIREAFRRNKSELPSGVDLVCVARQADWTRKTDVRSSLIRLAIQAAARWKRKPLG